MVGVEVLNGQFTKGLQKQDGTVKTGSSADVSQDELIYDGDLKNLIGLKQSQKPIIGETSGASRLVDSSFNSTLYTSITYDTSWMDIPINTMVNDIEYSNVTN